MDVAKISSESGSFRSKFPFLSRQRSKPRRDHVELIYRVRVGAVVVVVLAEADDTSNSVFQN